ncbi:MAG: hypothetical protein WBA13_09330 [Microcoleaceae cyanobacterium]
MSLETIILIIILTLQAICLGVSLFWLSVIETAFKSISNSSLFLELIAHIRLSAIQLMSVIFVMTLAGAIILNLIYHSRSEPYLLKIGLISFISFLVLVLSKFIFLEESAIAINFPLINNLLLWGNLLCITVSYWSFLHYALNPKI